MKNFFWFIVLLMVLAVVGQGYSQTHLPILFETDEEIIMQNYWIAVKILKATGEIVSFIYWRSAIAYELLTDTAFITIRDKRDTDAYRQSQGRVVYIETVRYPGDSIEAVFEINFRSEYFLRIIYTLGVQAFYWNAELKTNKTLDREANIDFSFPAIANMEYAFWTKDGAPFKLPITRTVRYRALWDVWTVIPTIILFNETKDIGLSFVSPFAVRKPKLEWEMRDDSFVIANRYLRLGQTHPCRVSVYIVPDEADWRPGLAWIYNKYPDYFNPVSETVLKGEGWFQMVDALWKVSDLASDFKNRGVTWVELHGHIPFYGVYLPNREALGDTAKDTWNVIIDMDSISYKRWRDSILPHINSTSYDSNRTQIKRWDSLGIQPYIYFQSFESWHQYPDNGRTEFLPNIALGANKEALPAWKYCYLMNPDPGDSWGMHIMAQIDSLLIKYPNVAGIFYDRDDYCDYDYKHNDSVTMIGSDSAYMLGFAQEKINDSVLKAVHECGKGVWTNGPTSVEVCKGMDGIMSENLIQAPSLQYLGIARPLILLPYDTTPQQTEEKLKTALWTGHFPSISWYDTVSGRADSCKNIEKRYCPLFSLYKGKKWVLYPSALQLPEGIKGNIFQTPDTDYLVAMVDPERYSSKIYPEPETTYDIFRYDRWVKVRVPDSAKIEYLYFLSGDYQGINQDTIYSVGYIKTPPHRATTLIQLSKEPRYEITRTSSPVLTRGDSGRFEIKVQNITGEGEREYRIRLVTPFRDTIDTTFSLSFLEVATISVGFMVPDTWSLGEETMKVIEEVRNDTIVFTAWVVDWLTFQLPEELFVHFAYSGDTIPFTLVNNTKESLKVKLSGRLMRGRGKVKFGTYPSQLYGEEGIYPPFQDTLQIGLKSLQAKELVVFIAPESLFDTVRICAEVEKLPGLQPKSIIIKRPVKRTMKKEESDLFYDDFSSGNMNKWVIRPDTSAWQVIDSVAKGDKNWHMAFAPLHLTPEWTDYKFQVNTKLGSSTNPLVDWIKSYIYFRVQNESTYYRFGIYSGFSAVSLWKRVNGKWQFLAQNKDFKIKKDIWYNLRVEVIGSAIKCFLDGKQVINVIDGVEPLLEGGIGIGVTEDAYVNYYDDVVVRKVPTSPER